MCPTTDGVWKVFITTGSDEDAGIEANITMVVYGSDGISPQIPITQSEQLAKMEAGKTQEFEPGLMLNSDNLMRRIFFIKILECSVII